MPTSETKYLPNGVGQGLRKQLLVLDTRLCVKSASDSFYSAFQTTPDEVVGKRLAAIGKGQWNIPTLLNMLNELAENEGELADFEMEQYFPGLGDRTILVGGRRLPALEGAAHGLLLLTIEDATAQKRIEEETGESLARFRTTLGSIADAVIATDLESRITFMNPAAERLTGWRKKHALHRLLPDIVQLVNEQAVKLESPVEKAILAGEPVTLSDHAILVARDGRHWPVDNSAAPILDAVGRITGVVLIFHEIAQRRKLEQELASSERRYRRLFESAGDGLLILDAGTGKILEVNPCMRDLLGECGERLEGKELWEIGLFKDAESAKGALESLERRGSMRWDDLPLRRTDGRNIPVELACTVYEEGERTLIQCNVRDVAERKNAARDLAKALEAAEAASRAKSEFLANMSHEIRTPMSAILGFAEMLLQKSAEECAQIGCARIIRQNSQHLLELINDILDLSKVEAGQMKVERIPFDLPTLLFEIVSLARPRAAEKGLGFDVRFDGPIPRLIQSDPERLRQILLNLISNAMKFTESGKIDLRIMDEGAGSPNILLRVDVIDSGIGMTQEQLGRLFRPFTQGDVSIARKFGGTGLGLTISRQLAKLLGGDVTATSQPRMGSTFTMRIDGGAAAGVETLRGLTEATLPAKLDDGVKNEIYLRGRILLVEDGADNQRLLRMQLSGAGASVVSAANGQMAVELATTQPFDLILMDMQMPVMDGYAATVELRRRGVKIPIIALTAYAMAEDRDKCIASGCDAYLSKPVDEETLLSAVNHALGNDRAPLPPENRGLDCGVFEAPAAAQEDGCIRSSLAGDPRMMEIIPAFVERLPSKVHKMLDFLESHELVALQQVVHELVGTAGGYGFAPVSPQARRAEQAIRANADRESIAAEITSLIALIRRIEGYEESKVAVASKRAAK
jgi:PAS domain S-box-containing protein